MRDHLVDLPIECPDDDELGFDQVSQALVEAISAQPNLSSMTLGLYQALTPSDLRSLRDPYEVLWAWREIEDSVDGPKALLEQAFISDEGFLATLDALRAYTSSSQNGVPHIPESYLEPFVDVKETKQRLSALAAKGNSAEDAAKMVHLWWSKER